MLLNTANKKSLFSRNTVAFINTKLIEKEFRSELTVFANTYSKLTTVVGHIKPAPRDVNINNAYRRPTNN